MLTAPAALEYGVVDQVLEGRQAAINVASPRERS